MGETIIVAGSLAQRPRHGGHTWVFLQYLLGFRQLGWDVHFVDCLEPGMCVDAAGEPAPFRSSANLRYLAEVMERFGLGDRWTLLYDGGREAAGRGRREVVERVRNSTLLLNVMGYLDDEEILAAAPCGSSSTSTRGSVRSGTSWAWTALSKAMTVTSRSVAESVPPTATSQHAGSSG